MTMAIVKASFTRSRAHAKAAVRYIAHRASRQQEGRAARELFNPLGKLERRQAYEVIDQAEKGALFFRFAISPDPRSEDTYRDLYLREITQSTMQALSRSTQSEVAWVATVHDDHAPHRHVHVLAVVSARVERGDLSAITQEATRVCQEQRAELDAGRELLRYQELEEEAGWE